jgi:hypothetical protein
LISTLLFWLTDHCHLSNLLHHLNTALWKQISDLKILFQTKLKFGCLAQSPFQKFADPAALFAQHLFRYATRAPPGLHSAKLVRMLNLCG